MKTEKNPVPIKLSIHEITIFIQTFERYLQITVSYNIHLRLYEYENYYQNDPY